MAKINLPELVDSEGVCDSPQGLRLISASACYYPPAVNSADLLLIDFDVLTVRHGGLYLIEETSSNSVVWRGCRRFDCRPEGLWLDLDGVGDWQPIDLSAVSWRIAGEVRQIFKPSM